MLAQSTLPLLHKVTIVPVLLRLAVSNAKIRLQYIFQSVDTSDSEIFPDLSDTLCPQVRHFISEPL